MVDQLIDTTDQQAVTVAQEDREAAANADVMNPTTNAAIRYGRCDNIALVQAFARHRLASVSSASVDAVTEAAKPWADYHGDLPDYDHPLRPVFESGIQYTVELLAKQLDVAEWVPCDGTEEFDGDLGGTLMNIVLEAMPKDEHGDAIWPRDLPGHAASPEPVPATNQAGEVAGDLRKQMYSVVRGWNIGDFASRVCSAKGHGSLPADICEAELDAFGEALITALATQPATSQDSAKTAADWVNSIPGVKAADQFIALDRRVFEDCVARALAATQPATSQEGEAMRLRDAVQRLIRLAPHDSDYVPVHQGVIEDLRKAVRAFDEARPVGEKCSFCESPSATLVTDTSDILPSCARCAEAWAADPGFTLSATPTPPTLSEDLRELVGTGHFLLDRLVDHEVRMTSDDDAREWYGHVTPAMKRFRAALAQVKAS